MNRNQEHEQEKGATERSYVILEERSPDLLFMRSILRIQNAELADFGRYNCTISNSKGSDTLMIDLQPSAPTGE